MIKLLPGFKGSWLLWCNLFKFFSLETRQVTFNEIKLDPASPPQFSILKRGSYEPMTSKLVSVLLKPREVFVDVGANFGYFSLLASKRAKLVLSFEPNKKAFLDLVDSINRNKKDNIIPFYQALADRRREVSLKKPWYRQTTGGYLRTGKEIRAVQFDSIYEKLGKPEVGLVKIDTEGAELLVLEGMKEMLGRDKPKIILESGDYIRRFNYKTEDLFKFLLKLSYESFLIDEERMKLKKINSPTQGQLLFIHKDENFDFRSPMAR